MIKKVLNEQEIQKICKSIANQINNMIKNTNSLPIFIGVMKGALPFMFDLMKYIEHPCLEDFIQVSSYEGTSSTGKITLKKDLSYDITNRDVFIIEDVVDTGITMNFLKEYLLSKYKPSSLTTISLLDKKCMRKVPFDVDIVGKEIPNEFVVGYGLDYNELGRNIPFVFIPSKEEIENFDKLLNTLKKKIY